MKIISSRFFYVVFLWYIRPVIKNQNMNTKLNLSERNKDLLLLGAKTTGSFLEGYYYVEESLYIDESDSLYEFCKYIENEIGGAGPINIQDLWFAFNHPQDKDGQDIANHWKKEMERINSYC